MEQSNVIIPVYNYFQVGITNPIIGKQQAILANVHYKVGIIDYNDHIFDLETVRPDTGYSVVIANFCAQHLN